MDASLVPSLFPGTLADNKAYYKDFPGGIKDITVAGQPGLLRTSKDPWMSGVIFAESLGEVLQIQWDDYAGKAAKAKVAAALKQVMEAARPRMASISFAEPSQRPAPSYRTDVDLAAMFPKTINGQPVTPQTYYLEDLFAAFGDTNEMGPQIAAVLATQGKTLDDVTGGLFQVPNTDPAASLSALRVIGADAATLVDPLLPLFSASTQGATIASATVAGRDVRTRDRSIERCGDLRPAQRRRALVGGRAGADPERVPSARFPEPSADAARHAPTEPVNPERPGLRPQVSAPGARHRAAGRPTPVPGRLRRVIVPRRWPCPCS